MACVAVRDGRVEVRLGLAERLLTLRGRLCLPLSQVAGVSEDPPPPASMVGVKIGLGLPGSSFGRFLTPEGVVFYACRDRRRCLTLHLKAGRWRRVVVELHPRQQPARVRAEIEAALSRQDST